jgi:hypothetical protein
MIVVSIMVTPDPGESGMRKTGSISIEEIGVHREDGTADYVVKFSADRVSGTGYHRRAIHRFPKDQFNHLALLRQALMTLDEEELRHDGKTLS